MVLFPHAKINLGLQVIEKRQDGFHNIITCLYPIAWYDVLELLKKPSLKFISSGYQIPGDSENNLCMRAYQLLKDRFNIPPVQIHLHKAIPIGAGLGGGSSDAAFTLKGLKQMFDLAISTADLEQMAAELGGDCPFFIRGKPALATGKGDVLQEISLNVPSGHLVVVTPPIPVNTAIAYSMIQPRPAAAHLASSLMTDISKWSDVVTNDFEVPVFRQYPAIAKVKETLLSQGAQYASLSGSGSSVYGVFKEKKKWRKWFGDEYIIWEQTLG